MKKVSTILLFILLVLISDGCIRESRKVANLYSFGKVYGYVRWFYPGNEVTELDWNKFTVYGVQKVSKAKNSKELNKILLELFKPLAPTITITRTNENSGFDITSIMPDDTSEAVPIAWKHLGVSFGNNSIYRSIRLKSNESIKILPGLIVSDSIGSPKVGEFIQKEIGNNLTLIMPIVLYSCNGNTYPSPDLNLWNGLKEKLNNTPDNFLSINNPDVRLANTVIAWNVFQHFYPYFNIVKVDWENELLKTLTDIKSSDTESEYYLKLMKMTAKLEDAHIQFIGMNKFFYQVKLKVDLFDNQIVVISSGSDQIEKGDIIETIDGKSALEELLETEGLISGSSNVKLARALAMFGVDPEPNDAKMIIIRDNREFEVIITRVPSNSQYFHNDNPNEIIDCGDSILYLKGMSSDISPFLSKLENSKGIIVGSYQLPSLLPHLIKEPVSITSGIFLFPVTSYPDRENVFWVSDSVKFIIEKPELPYINSKIAILTYATDQSRLESNLGFFDFLKLGTRIGDTTAGCNGLANYIPLIGGNSIQFTGMKVLKSDGSQHHLIGFIPDYPVNRTIEAMLQGKDEYLEKAKEILSE